MAGSFFPLMNRDANCFWSLCSMDTPILVWRIRGGSFWLYDEKNSQHPPIQRKVAWSWPNFPWIKDPVKILDCWSLFTPSQVCWRSIERHPSVMEITILRDIRSVTYDNLLLFQIPLALLFYASGDTKMSYRYCLCGSWFQKRLYIVLEKISQLTSWFGILQIILPCTRNTVRMAGYDVVGRE